MPGLSHATPGYEKTQVYMFYGPFVLVACLEKENSFFPSFFGRVFRPRSSSSLRLPSYTKVVFAGTPPAPSSPYAS